VVLALRFASSLALATIAALAAAALEGVAAPSRLRVLISRLTHHARFIPLMADHWQKTAPRGADTRSWRY